MPLLALPVDPRPLLPLPDDVDPEGPALPLLEGVNEGDPVLLREVELCEAYTIVVSVEPVIISAAKTRHKAKQTENLLFTFMLIILSRSFLQPKQHNISRGT